MTMNLLLMYHKEEFGRNSLQIAFFVATTMLDVDWFTPFKRSEYKVGAIMLTVLNLPREERYKKKWTIIAGNVIASHKFSPFLLFPTYKARIAYIQVIKNRAYLYYAHPQLQPVYGLDLDLSQGK